jgi:hypothetical protein
MIDEDEREREREREEREIYLYLSRDSRFRLIETADDPSIVVIRRWLSRLIYVE